MGQTEILIAGLQVAVVGLSALARALGVPYPIVLVIGGAVLGFVPGLPEVKLDPEVALVVSSRRCSTAPRSPRTSTTSAPTCAGSR